MILAMQPAAFRMTTTDLKEGERLFLWCIRRWVGAMFRKRDAGSELRTALASHALQSVAEDIDSLLDGISHQARRLIDIRVGGSTELSRDEVLFCRAFNAAAEGSGELLDALLGELVFHPGRKDAAAVMERVSAAFLVAGIETMNWRPPARPAGSQAFPPGVAAMPQRL